MSESFPTYHKINGVFKRHPDTNRFIMDQWSQPEYGLLADCDWQWFEKVDGTNVRIKISLDSLGFNVEFGGRTDGAQMPPRLVRHLDATFRSDEAYQRYAETFAFDNETNLILWGEGYGGKIQKGGHYRPDESFILFDASTFRGPGRHTWFSKYDTAAIADAFQIDMVPSCGVTSLNQAIEIVKNGFESQLGAPVPEGVVGTPAIDLFDRYHNRIIAKIKGVDFR